MHTLKLLYYRWRYNKVAARLAHMKVAAVCSNFDRHDLICNNELKLKLYYYGEKLETLCL